MLTVPAAVEGFAPAGHVTWMLAMTGLLGYEFVAAEVRTMVKQYWLAEDFVVLKVAVGDDAT